MTDKNVHISVSKVSYWNKIYIRIRNSQFIFLYNCLGKFHHVTNSLFFMWGGPNLDVTTCLQFTLLQKLEYKTQQK